MKLFGSFQRFDGLCDVEELRLKLIEIMHATDHDVQIRVEGHYHYSVYVTETYYHHTAAWWFLRGIVYCAMASNRAMGS